MRRDWEPEAESGGHQPTPWLLTAAQVQPERPLTPEQRLLWAVLEDAWRCVVSPVRRYQGQRQEALRWFTATDEQGPFAFLSLCGYLGLEPAQLQAWAQEHLAQERETRSRYRGVYRNHRDQRWIARIGKEEKSLGSYLDEDEAARVYNQAARKRYKNKARLNVITEHRHAA